MALCRQGMADQRRASWWFSRPRHRSLLSNSVPPGLYGRRRDTPMVRAGEKRDGCGCAVSLRYIEPKWTRDRYCYACIGSNCWFWFR